MPSQFMARSETWQAARVVARAIRRGAQRRGASVVCAFALSAVASRAQDGNLEAVREAVSGSPSEDTASYVVSWLWDEDGEETWFGDLFGFVLTMPFVLPRNGLGEEGFGAARFRDYPEHDGPGYWACVGAEDAGVRWSIRPRIESGTDFDDLERFGLGIQFEHMSRFGVDATWNRFREELAGDATDELDLGDANLVFRFAQSPRAAWRTGVGLNYFVDGHDWDMGINMTYGADFLASPNVTLGFETDLGTLGEATLLHGRLSAGFVLGRFELFGSVDGWDIDHANLTSFALGLRGWF